ncbi:hypothetical protein DXN04_27820 [Chitinophaga silvisoli]|uniref:Uncharacterized protein n=1 Tax=Chitinophaga silvisoli TaxID=2291814 RepID=A0A3E1NUU5_9BACT|nr:hypothetical protein DXN04_27820 [Chitinophaga silvisoli]
MPIHLSQRAFNKKNRLDELVLIIRYWRVNRHLNNVQVGKIFERCRERISFLPQNVLLKSFVVEHKLRGGTKTNMQFNIWNLHNHEETPLFAKSIGKIVLTGIMVFIRKGIS